MIVAYLKDRSSLSACSLVSHNWLISARPLLFKQITLRNQNRANERVKFNPFHTFVHARSSANVTQYIQRLNIRGTSGSLMFFVKMSDLEAMVSRLPALRSIYFSNIVVTPRTGFVAHNLTAKPLDVLHITQTYFFRKNGTVDPADPLSITNSFLELLSMFSVVKTLVLVYAQYRQLEDSYVDF